MNARETAERHGHDVVTGNRQGTAGDMTPEAMQDFMQSGAKMISGPTSYEIVGDEQEGDDHHISIRYNNGSETQTMRTTWRQMGDTWKIVKSRPAS